MNSSVTPPLVAPKRPRRAVDVLTAVATAAVFPAVVLVALALSSVVSLPVPRYDALLILFVAWTLGMLAFGVEHPRETATIALFHAMGVCMEFFKVNHGGWSYPEFAYSKVLDVPLYSGFMYASVGSFLLALTRRLDVQRVAFPSSVWVLCWATLAYANFFTNYWLPDAKWLLVAAAVWLFWRAELRGGVLGVRMPALAPFPVLGLLLWGAENWATAFGSWQYPRQAEQWTWVPPDKVLSWTVLSALSFFVVTLATHSKRIQTTRDQAM